MKGNNMRNGRTLYQDDAEIRIKVPKNPAREGTDSRKWFALAMKSKTFGDYREAGGNLNYLYSFQGRGKLEIID